MLFRSQIIKIKDKISRILDKYPAEKEQIKNNVRTFTMNIPDNNWYKKQWSFFLPPLFPVDIKIADINTQNIQHLCNSNHKYNVKYTILNRIKNISLYMMNDKTNTNNSNNTNNTIINLSKLIRLCYNIPSSANFIVSTKQNEEKIIEEIKIFDFSDTDRKSTRLNSSHSQQSRMPSSA